MQIKLRKTDISERAKQTKNAQIRAEEAAERRAARFEDARLRARRSRSATSHLFRFQQNEFNRLRVAERRQRETADQRETRLQSCDYNRLALRYNPADNYSLSRHVLICTMKVCSYWKA